ncbi:MAG: hypothetical protein AAF467_13080 [Actinomycetota bacterium]
MGFTVETWEPGYGSASRDDLDEVQGATVDASVEVDPETWAPIRPHPGSAPSELVFVDGVQRIDCRLWIDTPQGSALGLCTTIGAGAVRCIPGRAEVIDTRVERAVFTSPEAVQRRDAPGGAGDHPGLGDEVLAATGAGEPIRYRVRPVRGVEESATYQAINDAMADLEEAVSEALATEGELVVYDGPLRSRRHLNGAGYVKTQRIQYLDGPTQAVVARLGPGERTPLFAIGDPRPRWSWYLRLPVNQAHALDGVVRVELPRVDGAGVNDAAARADAISAALPRFASEPHREARAPQNLYPIAGLEHQLRRRLGDPHVLERALRRASLGADATRRSRWSA